MGGSEVLMAPQFGNKHGTLSIEPVSTRIVHKEVWEDFKEALAKVWMSYTDWDGSPLLSRVHWAKESPRSVTVQGVSFFLLTDWIDYPNSSSSDHIRHCGILAKDLRWQYGTVLRHPGILD